MTPSRGPARNLDRYRSVRIGEPMAKFARVAQRRRTHARSSSAMRPKPASARRSVARLRPGRRWTIISCTRRPPACLEIPRCTPGAHHRRAGDAIASAGGGTGPDHRARVRMARACGGVPMRRASVPESDASMPVPSGCGRCFPRVRGAVPDATVGAQQRKHDAPRASAGPDVPTGPDTGPDDARSARDEPALGRPSCDPLRSVRSGCRGGGAGQLM